MVTSSTSTPTLRIGTLAQLSGVSVRALRHYDAQGLLTSSRSANGYRVFPASCVTQVRQIQRLIGTGFSLEDIRRFPDCMRLVEGAQLCPETLPAHRQRLQLIERQLADLQRRRARLLATLAQQPSAVSAPQRARGKRVTSSG
ncbi:MerR family transcriptional regulator [Xanthomonas cassavae CFBP 4642]|uniref:MerR family transcriptional regulator n=1 Tax=Xanthomonas cassavae CFBP 4642 TaxID=1219375 RepID=A0ABS8HFQ0_9XANT|nr:MerR family transcriptional regulator [Xanthomonas cassavae]MCC4619965.1 MerR family transcriptional regulator [Xanthomonas cassavae CFBP 4642]